MKIVSGGQTGVDRAALDAAIARGLRYGGWCPKGGWAEDMPEPPGLLARYPHLQETPLADPAQRTEWNVRDADACLIAIDGRGLAVSKGTALAHELVARYGKPLLVVEISASGALARAEAWIEEQLHACGSELALAIGGPRESEAAGIYAKAYVFLQDVLRGK